MDVGVDVGQVSLLVAFISDISYILSSLMVAIFESTEAKGSLWIVPYLLKTQILKLKTKPWFISMANLQAFFVQKRGGGYCGTSGKNDALERHFALR